MQPTAPFYEVLEAVGQLTLEEQETLVDILRQRVIQQRRAELAADVRNAEREFEGGICRPATPDELMGEILS